MLSLVCVVGIEYYPTVVVHGIANDEEDTSYIAETISRMYPNMYVFNNEIGNGYWDSIFMELSDQVAELAMNVQNNPQLADGFNLLCHSQGSILCRAYIALYNNPPVRRLVTLAGPHGGYFCGRHTDCPVVGVIPMLEKMVDELFYTDFAQNMVSLAGYWRSPYEKELYLKGCRVLPVIDNEREFNQTVKDNYLGLNRIVMVGSPLDEMIRPWNSSFFAFYKGEKDIETEPLEDRDIYKKDLIGLKTIAERGGLYRIVAEGFDHNMYKWPDHQDWMKQNVYVHLNDTKQ